MADCIAGSFVAEQEGQCIDENGFSSAGFAGQEIETGGELHGDVVDDRVVFDPQFQEHSEFPVSRSLAGKLSVVSGESLVAPIVVA